MPYQLNIYSKVLAKTVCQLDVVALVVAVFVDVAEGALVAEYADGDLATVLDLVKGAVICARGIAVAGAAREQGSRKSQGRNKHSSKLPGAFRLGHVFLLTSALFSVRGFL